MRYQILWRALIFLLSVFFISVPIVRAQTPICGDTVTADLTFDKDLDCTGYTKTILIVGADDITIDGAGFQIKGSADYTGISISGKSNVTIKNLTLSSMKTAISISNSSGVVLDNVVITTSDLGTAINIHSGSGIVVRNSQLSSESGIIAHYGVRMTGTSNSRVESTEISGYYHGVRIDGGLDNVVQDNQLTGVSASGGNGVWLYQGADGTQLERNTITSFETGVWLWTAPNTRLAELNLSNIKWGFIFESGSLETADFRSVDNEMNGSTFSDVIGFVLNVKREVNFTLSGLNFTGGFFSEIGGAVVIGECSGIVIDGLTAATHTRGVEINGGSGNIVRNSQLSAESGIIGHHGVKMTGTSNSRVESSVISGYSHGVRIDGGLDNVVQDNQLTGVSASGGNGVWLYQGADGTQLERNTITSFETGVWLWTAPNTRLAELNLSNIKWGFMFESGSLETADFRSVGNGMNSSTFSDVIGFVLNLKREVNFTLSRLNFTGGFFSEIGGAVVIGECSGIVIDSLTAITRTRGVEINGGSGNIVRNSQLSSESGITADCGVRMTGTTNSRVESTEISGFYRGVRIDGGLDNVVQYNQLTGLGSGYGQGVWLRTEADGALVAFTTIAEYNMGINLDAGTENCTLRNDTITKCGWGISNNSSAPGNSMRNMIVYFNINEINNPNAFESITFSDINMLPVLPGVGNISANPMFCDLANNDFRLRPGSPAIDAGDPADPVPLGGGSRIDMGALEFTNVVVFGGFGPPLVDNDVNGVVDKAFKANRVISIKFQLYRMDGSIVTNVDIAPPLLELDYLGDDGTEVEEVDDFSAGQANEGLLFRFDTVSSQWIFNLSTKNLALGSYKILIKSNPDDTQYPPGGLDPISFIDENGNFIMPSIKFVLID